MLYNVIYLFVNKIIHELIYDNDIIYNLGRQETIQRSC